MGSESRYRKGARRHDRTSSRGRSVGGRAPVLALAVALLLSLIAAVAGASAAGIEIEVCQGDEATTEPECETGEINEQPSKPGNGGSTGGGSNGGGSGGGGGGEVHDFGISPGGEVTEESSHGQGEQDIQINLPKPGDSQAPVEGVVPGVGGDDHHQRPPKLGAPGTGGTGLPDVTTSGGSVGLGGSSPFDYVSSDEALSSFAIPPFLLPIYVSAGQAYDIPWNVLASINRIETDFGRLGACAVSSAGATGWMQFIPSTWDAYGVDASGDGVADPCNPVDAIYAAARYLDASGGSADLRGAIFAYNHADWYVDEVMTTAGVYGSLPSGLVAETGSLAFGHFPVNGKVLYGDDYRQAEENGSDPRGIQIFPRGGEATALATQDVTVRKVILDRATALALRRSGELKGIVDETPAKVASPDGIPEVVDEIVAAAVAIQLPFVAAPEVRGRGSRGKQAVGVGDGEKDAKGSKKDGDRPSDNDERNLGGRPDGAPEGEQPGDPASPKPAHGKSAGASKPKGGDRTKPAGNAKPERSKPERSADDDERPDSKDDDRESGPAWLPDGFEIGPSVGVEVEDAAGNRYGYEGLASLRKSVRPGEKLHGAEAIGPLRKQEDQALKFSTRGAGGALVDPRPLLDGYRLQELADYYNAVEPLGGNPFLPQEEAAGPGGVVDGTQTELARRVLGDSGIDIYECGRQDISRGIVDRRILGTLLYLRKAGMTLTVTSLRCGHGYYTAGGSVSAHSFGAAVDIAAFNGQSVLGNQGPGSLTEHAIKLLMQLEGEAQPAQLISLMDLGGSSFALSDHADHLHVGYNFDASLGLGRSGETAAPVVFGSATGPAGLPDLDSVDASKEQERRLSDKLAEIDNPGVRGDVGPNGVQIEGERAGEKHDADRLASKEQPFELTPTSAGAKLTDIDALGGDTSYAIGTVDGTAAGWAEDQTVALVGLGDSWRVLGPPRDKDGRVTNPTLRAIAANGDGHGFAVGEKGAVVELRGDRAPVEVDSPTKQTLTDVAVSASGAGFAVGEKGTSLSLNGDEAKPAPIRGTDANLAAIAANSTGEGFVAVGEEVGGEPFVIERGGGEWESAELGFRVAPDTEIELESVAVSGPDVWIGGAIGDAETSGGGAELPFAARRQDSTWLTYCSGSPALANIRELGTPSRPDACDQSLPLEVGETGPVSAIAFTDKGPLFATHRALRYLDGNSFRSVPGAPAASTRLGVSPEGSGYVLAHDGRMARIEPQRGGDPGETPAFVASLPQAGGPPAPVAAAPGGDRVLVFGGGESAVQEGDEWSAAPKTMLAVRDAGFVGDSAWAIDESGSLISWDGEGSAWEVPGLDDAEARSREELARSLGANPLSPGASGADAGYQALAFASDLEGFAVGGSGLISRFLSGEWHTESSPSDANLRDVAAGVGGVIAVGDDGTLLERAGDDWALQPDAKTLVGGQDFSSADALSDGSLLAVAGGSVIERAADAEIWEASEVPPLGVPVEKIAGYRDADETLHVIALVGAEEPVLLEGTTDGWARIALPDEMQPSAFAPEPGAERIWVSGAVHGRPIAAPVDLAPTSSEEDEADAPEGDRLKGDQDEKPVKDEKRADGDGRAEGERKEQGK